MVGILTPTNAGKTAALLADPNPSAALAAYERNHAAERIAIRDVEIPNHPLRCVYGEPSSGPW